MKHKYKSPKLPQSIINIELNLEDEQHNPISFCLTPRQISIERRLLPSLGYKTSILIRDDNYTWDINLENREAIHGIYIYKEGLKHIKYTFKNLIVN